MSCTEMKETGRLLAFLRPFVPKEKAEEMLLLVNASICEWSNQPNGARMDVMREALTWALEMFEARDVMNAKVHCSPVRLSPITERCKQALKDTTP